MASIQFHLDWDCMSVMTSRVFFFFSFSKKINKLMLEPWLQKPRWLALNIRFCFCFRCWGILSSPFLARNPACSQILTCLPPTFFPHCCQHKSLMLPKEASCLFCPPASLTHRCALEVSSDSGPQLSRLWSIALTCCTNEYSSKFQRGNLKQ